MAKNILIINPFGVGDVLFSTPLVSLLKGKYSGCNIAYICNIRTKDILETNPDVDEVIVFERSEYRQLWRKSKPQAIRKFFKFWKGIGARRFDMVLDLSLGKEFAFLCWLVGIKDRRGFNYKGRGRFLNRKLAFNGFNEKPVAEYYLDLIDSQEKKGTVLLAAEEDKRYIDGFLKKSGIMEQDLLVGVAPGGGISFGKKDQDRRRWPAKRFAELADRISREFKAKIILIWGPGEEELVREIAGLMKGFNLVAPATSIRQMAALCKCCKVVICSEGGPLHIASSQKVRTISIFGPVDEKVYGPYPPGERNVVISSGAECRPCYKRFRLPECNTKICLEDISVNDMFEAFRNLR